MVFGNNARSCGSGTRLASALALLLSALLLGGCAGQQPAPPAAADALAGEAPRTAEQFQQQVADAARMAQLNEQLLMLAVARGSVDESVYRVGPEDSISIKIFGVPELSQEYRVDGRGEIMMPLIGGVAISGLTLSEVESLVARRYGESYLRSPQVSAQIKEFRSQQYTVIGAVSRPQVYSASRQTTLVEALALAGGVSTSAGDFVYLTDRIRDPETGTIQVRTLVIPIDELLRRPEKNNVVIGEGALINVPAGGFVFIEGDVGRPGAIPQTRTTTVLTALAQAGGVKWEADKANMRLMRRDPDNGEWLSFYFSYDEIREDPTKDMPLRNGDVLVVASNPLRSVWLTTWKALGGLIFLGGRPFTW